MSPNPNQQLGSRLIASLESAYAALSELQPDLPQNTLFSVDAGVKGLSGALRYVPPTYHRPHHRIEVMYGTLEKGAVPVFTAVAHGAAHALAHRRRIPITSRQTRYHNSKFQLLAEELGLHYTQPHADPERGFSDVTPTPHTLSAFGVEIARIQRAISTLNQETRTR